MKLELQPVNIYRWVLGIAAVAFAVIFPLNAQPYLLRVACTMLVFAVVCCGLNLILGYTGLFSFGHAAFFGIGAYAVSLLMLKAGWTFLPATIVGVVSAGVLGGLVGMTAWRVRGDYLALVTLGFGSILVLVLTNWDSLTGGPSGLPGVPLPTIFGYQFSASGPDFYYLCLGVLAVTMAFCAWLARSYFGRAMLTIREDEMVARGNGINVSAMKVAVFAIGGAIAGLGGSLQAMLLGFVGPQSFTLDQSILMVEIVVVGGMATTFGPVIGATILLGANEIFRGIPEWRSAIFGVIMVLILIFRSDGVAGLLNLPGASPSQKRSLLRRKGPKEPVRKEAKEEPAVTAS